jgi:hypothetical protein
MSRTNKSVYLPENLRAFERVLGKWFQISKSEGIGMCTYYIDSPMTPRVSLISDWNQRILDITVLLRGSVCWHVRRDLRFGRPKFRAMAASIAYLIRSKERAVVMREVIDS